MVKLVVQDIQVSILEIMLNEAGIDYKLCVKKDKLSLKSPYLIVDGVPLDMGRASKWIKENSKNE